MTRTLLFVVLTGSIAGAVSSDPTIFESFFSRYRFKPSQPFAGSMQFKGKPEFGKPASIHIELNALADLDTVQVFELVTMGLRSPVFDPGEIRWEAPIDSGATKSFDIKFTPEYVGGYELLFSRYLPASRDWQSLGRLMLAYDEDANLVCYGTSANCGAAVVPLHPIRTADKLSVEFPQIEERKGQPTNRDFSASFDFLKPPVVGDTCRVVINLECQRNLYQEVQYVAEHSTNLRIIQMPESWGNDVGVNPEYRFFSDTLSFVLVKDGLSYLNFQIVGKHPHAKRGNHLTTDFPIYFLTSAEEGLLYLGDFDPIKRFSTVNSTLLGSLTQLPTAGTNNYRIKYSLSKPDYRAAADSAAVDSTGVNNK